MSSKESLLGLILSFNLNTGPSVTTSVSFVVLSFRLVSVSVLLPP